MRQWLERIARIGDRPGDPPGVKAAKASLATMAVLISVVTPIWVISYLALGLPLSAVIPLVYVVGSLGSFVQLARTGDSATFRRIQFGLMLVLPFVLQWTLGGFANASAVMLWASVTPLAALAFAPLREAMWWFFGYLVLTAVSGVIDARLAALGLPVVPELVRTAFFVLDIGVVGVVTFVVLAYFVRGRQRALDALAAEHRALVVEEERSERLLRNILPERIAERLKDGEEPIADALDDVTVLFADVVGFTPLTAGLEPDALVLLLDDMFARFDRLAEVHGLEKIKTIGDAYMAVAGLPGTRPDHADAAASMALDIPVALALCAERFGSPLDVRIGLASGPAVAGVIGRSKFIYDLWGDTVNMASRMESHGVAGRIQVAEPTYLALRDRFQLEPRGDVEIKGKGRLRTWFLVGPAAQNVSSEKQ